MERQLSRRDFLQLTGVSSTLAALAACSPDLVPQARSGGPVAKPAATLLDADGLILHTLRRATFGPTAHELVAAQTAGLELWIEQQLDPATLDHAPVDARLTDFETLNMSPAELAELDDNARVATELVAGTLTRQIYSPAQLYELMVDFWTNHFNIHAFQPPELYLKGQDDRAVIRAHALGSFPELLRASAHSPAMLVYLDNAQSRQPEPNENYARELMELHSLGVDGGYSHADIDAVALAFTGWSVEGLRRGGRSAGEFTFRAEWHDRGPKTVLGYELPGGQADGDRVLKILAEHPSTARHIAGKLVGRFVADDPPTSLVEAVTASYTDSGGDIPTMLRTIFYSDEFASSAGQKLKRPLDFAVSAIRVSGADGRLDRLLRQYLRLLGQIPFGWPAPDGYPDYAAAWSSTSQSLYRWNLALTLASGAIRGVDLALPVVDGSIPQMVDALCLQLLGQALPPDAQKVLIDFGHTVDAAQLPRQVELVNVLAGLVLCSSTFQLR